MIKKTPVQNPTGKTRNEQSKLLSAFEKHPNAAEMCWFITTYHKARDVRLFKYIYARTSSLASDGIRVHVGLFASGGLDVSNYRGGHHCDDVGLSAARK
ncbi:hypothetical protein KKF05_01330 [Patescibacteria group bacterium]|nr:hypothetical protein [Patescibacteria group bacterium]MBU1916150.1 hypothetical protein [Patescibacteria group bacterium]